MISITQVPGCSGAFVLKRPGQNDETATSLIHEYDDQGDQVISIVIPFA